MSKVASGQPGRIDRFFAGPGARGDQWRNLVELPKCGPVDQVVAPRWKQHLRN